MAGRSEYCKCSLHPSRPPPPITHPPADPANRSAISSVASPWTTAKPRYSVVVQVHRDLATDASKPALNDVLLHALHLSS